MFALTLIFICGSLFPNSDRWSWEWLGHQLWMNLVFIGSVWKIGVIFFILNHQANQALRYWCQCRENKALEKLAIRCAVRSCETSYLIYRKHEIYVTWWCGGSEGVSLACRLPKWSTSAEGRLGCVRWSPPPWAGPPSCPHHPRLRRARWLPVQCSSAAPTLTPSR